MILRSVFIGGDKLHSLRKRQQRQQNPLESQITSQGIKPFIEGVGAAAAATGADGYGFASQREGNIGIG